MYVCVCNAVTEDDVRGCVVAGACSAKEVRAACGMQPGCGACTRPLRTLVSESLASPPWLHSAVPDPAGELVDHSVVGGPRPASEGPLQAVAGDDLPRPMEPAEVANRRPAEHAA